MLRNILRYGIPSSPLVQMKLLTRVRVMELENADPKGVRFPLCLGLALELRKLIT